jgi:hypothetical protein
MQWSTLSKQHSLDTNTEHPKTGPSWLDKQVLLHNIGSILVFWHNKKLSSRYLAKLRYQVDVYLISLYLFDLILISWSCEWGPSLHHWCQTFLWNQMIASLPWNVTANTLPRSWRGFVFRIIIFFKIFRTKIRTILIDMTWNFILSRVGFAHFLNGSDAGELSCCCEDWILAS